MLKNTTLQLKNQAFFDESTHKGYSQRQAFTFDPAANLLKSLVGAGRIERPTSCSQSSKPELKINKFQVFCNGKLMISRADIDIVEIQQ